MSTLTKILVILLSLFSIFLCGMMVTFVGSANNYKELYEQQKSENSVIKAAQATLSEQYDAQVAKAGELQTKLQQEIQNLEAEKNQLSSDLRKEKRLAMQYQAEASNSMNIMQGFEQSVRNLQASLTQTQTQLDAARAQDIKTQKELNQITADLYEKIVQLQSLESERRRLLEQKKSLEDQLTTTSGGGAPVEIIPVTQSRRTAVSALPTAAGADIRGLVLNVSQSLVQLSVGSSDGVKENMTFHITRGDSFLCDVVVTDVDINQCAGVLEMVQQRPQVGDTASTQL